MKTDQQLTRLLHSSRLRLAMQVALIAAPLVVALAVLGWRAGGTGWSTSILATGMAIALLAAWLATRRVDTHWLSRRLDECDPRMEDSAALLFNAAATPPLQRLQRQRLQQRLEDRPPPDVRPAWPMRTVLSVWLGASLVSIAILAWPAPRPERAAAMSPASQGATSAPTHTVLASQQLDIAPPAYTRLPTRHETTLETRVPEGASVRWSLRFNPAPVSAALAFHDGHRIPMQREGDDWVASRRIEVPVLYRVEVEGLPLLRNRLQRIDVVPDQPPQIRAIAPEETLTIRREDQRNWSLVFDAQDDYGLAASAPLRITLAQGEGENIRFEEREVSLTGRGDATHRHYSHNFDLSALGLTPGSDLVVQLSVNDNRGAGPQTVQSASYILRWPPEDATQTTGLDGLVKKALPAYFRSQRQIIIDSEALLAQRRRLAADDYVSRSDAIGVDQRLLRLRYGQFLGEESEGSPRVRLPTADAEEDTHEAPRKLLPTADADSEAETASSERDEAESHDEHDHGGGKRESVEFGEAGDVLAEYGHTHDDSEAATLLDPETRRTLKAALDQMWQAELNLRQGHPDLALPFEYKALDYIKQVQQAGRIYLARVGSELPPIDPTRRLSGDRKGLAPRGDSLAMTPPTSALLESLWRALEVPASPDAPPLDLGGTERWLRANEKHVPDALGVIAAIDGVRSEPECEPCRQQLRKRLWPLLRRPPAQPAPRTLPDRSGQAYLDALQAERP
ncbi:hypothetical protein [Lysobacter tyrosinilyticus]